MNASQVDCAGRIGRGGNRPSRLYAGLVDGFRFAQPIRAIGLGAGVLFGLALPIGAAMGGGDPTTVIAFALNRLDAAGIQGPPGGRRALDDEFCIPQGQVFRDQVAAIDPTARFQAGSRGRIGCGPALVLVLGNTHQGGYREVLLGLAGLPFVERIAEALFE